MKYDTIVKATFQARPNRFIAVVQLDGEEIVVHVKNTGRCKELLIPGATVYLEEANNPNRKTKYSLVCVEKNGRLINMDSQAPNKAWHAFLKSANATAVFGDIQTIKKEVSYGVSRLDFYVETENEKIYMEVKGVTLEANGVVSFPDAPTERGVKHLKELTALAQSGYKAVAVFVIQMENVEKFEPNWENHREFALALVDAVEKGVSVLAYDCIVTPNEMRIHQPVPIDLTHTNSV